MFNNIFNNTVLKTKKPAKCPKTTWPAEKCGTTIRVPLYRIQKNYLLMESLPIEPPLSIFTLMMWIEFLSE